MIVAIISDTHLPRGNRKLPDACLRRLHSAHLIIHAGDLTTLQTLAELQAFGRVLAVHGNADDGRVRAALPKVQEVELEGTRLVVIHDAGARVGRIERLRRRYPAADAVIFGHSHLPLHETAEDGFQIFNPGSPTDKRRAPSHTMGIARAVRGRLAFRLVQLD
jgi:putative phosphoesterase